MTVGALRLHAKASVDPVPPERPPLVLVHGLLVSSRYLLAAAVRLAPSVRVYTLDLPGYGQSSKPPPPQELAQLSAVLDAWMAACGLEQAVLLANSFGCQIVTDFALRYPHRVALWWPETPTA